MARRVVLLVLLVVAAGAAYALIGDFDALGGRLLDLAWWALPGAAGLSLLNYAVRFARWQVYLRAQEVVVPRGDSAAVFLAGLSLAISPGKLGELFKSYLLRELHGAPVARTAPIVLAERVTDLTALVVLALIGVALYGVAVPAALASAAVVAAGLVVLAWPALARGLIGVVTAPGPLRRLRPTLLEVYGGLAGLCRPRPLVLATAIACGGWACECVGFALVVHGFPGASIDLGLAMAIYALTTIVGALSFLPGGLGVTEGSMTYLLVHSGGGMPAATAAAATIVIRLATLWLGVGIGLIAMVVCDRKVARASGGA
jgi:uncharacterized membrane protein YbhN (UPF0104 family)